MQCRNHQALPAAYLRIEAIWRAADKQHTVYPVCADCHEALVKAQELAARQAVEDLLKAA